MAGAFQTPEGLKHWKESYTGDNCPFCNKSGNSKKHLFFICEHTKEARITHKKFLDEYYDWSEIIYTLPVCTIFAEENILNKIRFERQLPKANFRYNHPDVKTFFTDGSALVADLEVDREAAWAIVEDLCQ